MLQVMPQGSGDSAQAYAVVIIEGMVFNSNYRIYQVRGHVLQGNPCPVFDHEPC